MKAGWNAGSCHCGRIVMKAFVHQSIRPLPFGRHGRLSAKDDHLSRQPMSSRGTDHMSEKSLALIGNVAARKCRRQAVGLIAETFSIRRLG
jgi:hypothetical protein